MRDVPGLLCSGELMRLGARAHEDPREACLHHVLVSTTPRLLIQGIAIVHQANRAFGGGGQGPLCSLRPVLPRSYGVTHWKRPLASITPLLRCSACQRCSWPLTSSSPAVTVRHVHRRAMWPPGIGVVPARWVQTHDRGGTGRSAVKRPFP
jgi:hypothetical protein